MPPLPLPPLPKLRALAVQGEADPERPAHLVHRTRSLLHPWFLWVAAGAGAAMALMIPMASLLAAAEPGSHSPRELWTVAVIVVAVIAFLALGVCAGCGLAAILTRPVRDAHDANLKATALSLRRSLGASFSEYGSAGFRPEQAFRAHYKHLTARLDAWDALLTANVEAGRVLGEHIDATMAERGLMDSSYSTALIKPYARTVAMAHAEGDLPEPPHIEWGRASTAGKPEPASGAQGMIGPDATTVWISVPPLAGETWDEWVERSQPSVDHVESFIKAIHASSLPHAEAALGAQESVTAFKKQEAPAIQEALQLIQEREPTRVRPFRCEAC